MPGNEEMNIECPNCGEECIEVWKLLEELHGHCPECGYKYIHWV